MPVRISTSALTRAALRAWSKAGIASGYHYCLVEKLAPTHQYVLSTRLPNGAEIVCDLSEHVERQIYFQGTYEPLESRLFTSLVKPGMTVIDAGANIGQYSLLGSTAVSSFGEVHSFEPVPRNFEQLKSNVTRNKLSNVRTNQMALWHRREKLNFGRQDVSANNSGSFCVQPTGFAVEAISLDEYANTLSRVDLIKMDVEGSEPYVLQGALQTIRRFRPLILMEVNRCALAAAGSSAEILWDMLQSLGYRIVHLAHHPADRTTLTGFGGFEQINILASVEDQPLETFRSWTIRDALRWSRSGW